MGRNLALKLLTSLAITSALATTAARAQDYPYDDYVPELRKKKEYDPKYKVPVERPKKIDTQSDAVFGLNLQGGGTFAMVQNKIDSVTSTSASGPGYAVALGFGWDMQNHPLSIEIETGYQQLLMGTQYKLSVVPLKFSTFYWTKLGPDSVFRVGLGSSLDLRMAGGEKGIFPGWNLSAIYEYASFTFEPALEIMRLRSKDSFLAGAFYLGYRI